MTTQMTKEQYDKIIELVTTNFVWRIEEFIQRYVEGEMVHKLMRDVGINIMGNIHLNHVVDCELPKSLEISRLQVNTWFDVVIGESNNGKPAYAESKL